MTEFQQVEKSLGLEGRAPSSPVSGPQPDRVALALGAMGEFVAPVDPPPDLLDRIEGRLDADLLDRLAAAKQSTRRRFWQGLATGAGAMALAATVLVALLPPGLWSPGGSGPGSAAERITAELAAADATRTGQIRIALSDPAQYLLVDISAITLVEDRSLELWLIETAGAAPRSLGLVTPYGDETVLPVSDLVRAAMAAGAVLAVSEEPLGGSPGAGPTGPVVYVGQSRADGS